jgi:osmotically-inducible protein OsmY
MAHSSTVKTLSECVRSELARVTLGSMDALSVAVDVDGRVILDGVLHSLARHLAAVHTAQAVPGVLVVEDLIKIRL